MNKHNSLSVFLTFIFKDLMKSKTCKVNDDVGFGITRPATTIRVNIARMSS